MPGIIHKESLPAQGLIKRRRVDTQPTAAPPTAPSAPASTPAVRATNTPAASSSASGSSSSDDDRDDDDGEVERENARLAKRREQRRRRHQANQQQHAGGGGSACASSRAAAPATVHGGGGEGALRTNSYDHDVLFRNAAWRSASQASTPAEKRKQTWDSVLNRTQDSAAFKHFMKNFFR
ncbi:hypothetical protein NESM_000634200 [Novymonas esmeraldas]|uniref:Uncharacterized protein n=1 Tax=Novymonas esmeraldas TaxID=1808958 RepID=A0AAW0ETK4_9TRYP